MCLGSIPRGRDLFGIFIRNGLKLYAGSDEHELAWALQVAELLGGAADGWLRLFFDNDLAEWGRGVSEFRLQIVGGRVYLSFLGFWRGFKDETTEVLFRVLICFVN
jgi:hypothetical protein